MKLKYYLLIILAVTLGMYLLIYLLLNQPISNPPAIVNPPIEECVNPRGLEVALKHIPSNKHGYEIVKSLLC